MMNATRIRFAISALRPSCTGSFVGTAPRAIGLVVEKFGVAKLFHAARTELDSMQPIRFPLPQQS
jgi:hypothetical protein